MGGNPACVCLRGYDVTLPSRCHHCYPAYTKASQIFSKPTGAVPHGRAFWLCTHANHHYRRAKAHCFPKTEHFFSHGWWRRFEHRCWDWLPHHRSASCLLFIAPRWETGWRRWSEVGGGRPAHALSPLCPQQEEFTLWTSWLRRWGADRKCLLPERKSLKLKDDKTSKRSGERSPWRLLPASCGNCHEWM